MRLGRCGIALIIPQKCRCVKVGAAEGFWTRLFSQLLLQKRGLSCIMKEPSDTGTKEVRGSFRREAIHPIGGIGHDKFEG